MSFDGDADPRNAVHNFKLLEFYESLLPGNKFSMRIEHES
jgi:hypothetical protein